MTVQAPGTQTRSFCYVSDMVSFCVLHPPSTICLWLDWAYNSKTVRMAWNGLEGEFSENSFKPLWICVVWLYLVMSNKYLQDRIQCSNRFPWLRLCRVPWTYGQKLGEGSIVYSQHWWRNDNRYKGQAIRMWCLEEERSSIHGLLIHTMRCESDFML